MQQNTEAAKKCKRHLQIVAQLAGRTAPCR